MGDVTIYKEQYILEKGRIMGGRFNKERDGTLYLEAQS
jgi:hypothetical protein